MKKKYFMITLIVTLLVTLTVVSNVSASALNPIDGEGGGLKRDTDCCEDDCCSLSTDAGCFNYNNKKCPAKCSAIAKLPNFVKTYPRGMTAKTYIRSSGDSMYQVCFSGAGLIYRYYYGDWVNLGGVYTGFSGKTCVFNLKGDGVYVFVQ